MDRAKIAWMLRTSWKSGLLGPTRPDRYAHIINAVRREGISTTTGLTISARRCPGRAALVDERGALTWAQLESRVEALAAGLVDFVGSRPRTVAVLCRNHRGFVEALFAASKLGSNVVLLNTAFAGPQLTDVLTREGADVLVHDEEFSSGVRDCSINGRIIPRVLGWIDENFDDVSVDQLIDSHRGQRVDSPDRFGKIVLLTSGTTGSPKGASRDSAGGMGLFATILDRIPWRAEEVVVVAAPMFHAWGLAQLMIGAAMSCTLVVRRRFDAEATLAMVAIHRATGLAVVPVMLERIVDLPDPVRRRYDVTSLRFVTASGSRMRTDAVSAFMDEFGDVVYNSYNSTEAGMISAATPADLRFAADTAGRPVAGTELRVLDDANCPVAVGEVGRIFARNEHPFEGYTSGGNKNFHEGFMATGDVGRLDDAGRLYVVGRDDEMIVSGGENVYPLEVEETLVRHPGVIEAAVVGVDDEQFGQRLEAFVVLANAGVTPDELKTHVRDNLANFKVPRRITLLDELPRTSTGKVLKRELARRPE